VDVALRRRKSKFRVRTIDPDCLQEAFDAGESPVTFSMRADISPRKPGQKLKRKHKFQYWILALGLFIPLAFYFRVMKESLVERAAMESLQTGNRWPRRLPIVTKEGPFIPKEAEEAQEAAKELIKDMLLNPKAAEFLECEVLAIVHPGQYQIEGEVSSTNQAGATAVAEFKLLVAWPYEIRRNSSQPKAEWIKGKGPWKIIQKELERTAESTIWREEDVFRQPRKAATKRTSNLIQRSGTPIYAGDRE
jgi:hypothetical protein